MSGTEATQQIDILQSPRLISVVDIWKSSTSMERVAAVFMCSWGTLCLVAFAFAFLLAY